MLGKVPQIFRQQFGDKPPLLIADTNTFAAAGRAVLEAFRHAGHDCHEPFLFTAPQLYAEHNYVLALEAALQGHDDIPVAVGSGTINDLTKLAAHRAGRPYLAVAAAASMDGYTAFGASITCQGSKRNFECPAPVAVVADLDVICAAPAGMNAAGYADLLAKTTAGADWMLADALGISCKADCARRWPIRWACGTGRWKPSGI
jgi:glycerol-1-phosphate dehydrogenase [NAD(P)+]